MTMRTLILTLSILLALAAAAPALAQDADPVAVLQSGTASFLEKGEACRILEMKGGPEAVATLEPLLLDEKLSHMARLALEAMPCPEALKALRDALDKTKGALKAGVIGSLAVRQDMTSVPAIIGLLSDADPVVAQAAAAALGRLATQEAAVALQRAMAQKDVAPGNMAAFCDGLCACAATLAAKGQREQALAFYQDVLKLSNTTAEIRAAALRGVVLTLGAGKGLPVLMDALRGDDEGQFAAALRIARELDAGDAVSAALADALPKLPENRKVQVIQVLGERGGNAAGPALLAEANTGPTAIRVAALGALTRIGYVSVLALVKELVMSEDAELAQAAKKSLSYFPGKEGDDIIAAMLRSDDAKTRRLAVELVGNGALDAPELSLMAAAQNDADEGIRIVALEALRSHAGVDQMQALLDRLLATQSPAEMKAAENTLTALCAKQRKSTANEVAVQEAVYGSLSDGPSVDVTEEVAQLVASGSMSVEASNRLFGDTAPGLVKQLRVTYTVKGSPATQTAQEGETMVLNTATAPAVIVDAFCAAFEKSQGEVKPIMMRLLGATGSAKAFDMVKAAALQNEDAAIRDTALRVVCEWPNAAALSTALDLALRSGDPAIKALAWRGAVRMLAQGQIGAAERLSQYALLMANAGNADDKKLVLSGLAQLPRMEALEMVLREFNDAAVKAEAVQAAITIAKGLGKSAREDAAFSNMQNIDAWQGTKEYWRFEDGAVTGGSDKQIPRNEFLWAPGEVGDFYLVVDVKLDPPSANAGIQFRSKKVDDHGQALGYQADVGQDVWGRLYHEHGRGKLDWTNRADAAVKPGEWNRYEILAVGPAIWTAINGKLGTACLDINAQGERTGGIAVQIHGGPPQKASYRFVKLVHNPEIKLEGMDAKRLFNMLKIPEPQP